MLANFEIKGFRTFNELTLIGLGDVNIVAGRNNVGKTMLLEAIRLHASKADPLTVRSLLNQRDEWARRGSGPDDNRTPTVDLVALFHGRGSGISPTQTIRMGPPGIDAETLRLRLGFVHRQPGPDVGPPKLDAFPTGESPVVGRIGIETQFGDQQPVVVLQDEQFFAAYRELVDARAARYPHIPFVTAAGVSAEQVAAWWDEATLTDAEQRVVDCLRLVSPVDKIALVRGMGRASRVPYVKLAHEAAPVPMRALGDGVERMFGIALAMEAARTTGLLLIDEIENGIHYAVLPSLWHFIIRAASHFGVQVFAATHSWDCIDAFQHAAQATDSSRAALVRLVRSGDVIEPTVFLEDELVIATRDRIEVR